MQNNLIYLISFGAKAYHEMARLCVHSLRTWGKFDGDIVVFSDGSYKGCDNEETVINLPPLTGDLEIKSLKSEIVHYVDIKEYAQIAYIDTDMFAISDVRPMFRATKNYIVCADEFPFCTMLQEADGGDLLKFHERSRARNIWGINTGFVCMRSQYFEENMGIWSKAIKKYERLLHEFKDQPCFNRLVFQKKLHVKLLPRHTVEHPPLYAWSYPEKFRIRKVTKLLHVLGGDKDISLESMSMISERLERGDSLKQLGKLIQNMLENYANACRTGDNIKWGSVKENSQFLSLLRGSR